MFHKYISDRFFGEEILSSFLLKPKETCITYLKNYRICYKNSNSQIFYELEFLILNSIPYAWAAPLSESAKEVISSF